MKRSMTEITPKRPSARTARIPQPETARSRSRKARRWPRPLSGVAVALALSLAACGSSRQSEASPTPAPTIATPALWEVKDADTTIYLFGTIHMLKPGTRWFEGPVKAAFDRSDKLMLEIVEPDSATMATLVGKLGVAPAGSPPLSSRLSPTQRAQYLAALATYQLPAAAMDRLDPWMVALTLSIAPLRTLGYDQDSGVEKTLSRAAQTEGKPIGGLETVEQQLGYFDTLPQPVQIAYLNSTVEELPKVESEFDQLIRSWSEGRPDALAKQLNESMETMPELAKVLLFQRNANWADWIGQRMKQPGTLFIAVGAGHLAGKGSVIDRLTRRHFKVRRLSARDFPPAPAASAR